MTNLVFIIFIWITHESIVEKVRDIWLGRRNHFRSDSHCCRFCIIIISLNTWVHFVLKSCKHYQSEISRTLRIRQVFYHKLVDTFSLLCWLPWSCGVISLCLVENQWHQLAPVLELVLLVGTGDTWGRFPASLGLAERAQREGFKSEEEHYCNYCCHCYYYLARNPSNWWDSPKRGNHSENSISVYGHA